jgi:hypothetical protein
MKNIGRIWINNSRTPWCMEPGGAPISGDEFSSDTDEFDAFLEGFLHGAAVNTEAAYVLGDFFGERTHMVIMRTAEFPIERFCLAVKLWLSAPRRSNWRVFINGEKFSRNMWLVYDTLIMIGDKTRGAAINEVSSEWLPKVVS